jgi:hypothetical protein
MLCSICQSIDFTNASCSPGEGGAKHQPTFQALVLSAKNGCELCDLLISKGPERVNEIDGKEGAILCSLWNWYEGPTEEYRGSATIVFFEESCPWSVILGIFADTGS